MKNLLLIFILIVFQSCTFSDEDNQGIYSEVTSNLECWATTLQSSRGVGTAVAITGNDIYLAEGKYNSSGILVSGSDGDLFYLSKYNSCGKLEWQSDSLNTTSTGKIRDLVLNSEKNSFILIEINNQLELLKFNSSGTKVWTQTTALAGGINPRQIVIDNDSNIYVVGYTNTNQSASYGGNTADSADWGSEDFFIRKYDHEGTNLWTHQWGAGGSDPSTNNDTGTAITIDNFNNVYVAGQTKGCPSGLSCGGGGDVSILKLNSSGNRIWTKVYGDGSSDHVLRITYHNGYIYFWGASDRISGYSWALTKLDTDGNQIWDKGVTVSENSLTMSGFSNNQGGEMIFDSENNLILSGTLYNSFNNNSLWISKFNTDGEMLFEKVVSSGSNDELRDVAVDSENNIYITGFTEGSFDGRTNSGTSDMFVMKLNSNGQVQ
ncbi:MAG: SBBP repeat-containing protein [Proteobacteria bacterium]|nr:SBBP repeat-containing protein [Pseudomonadota bacterium]